MVARSQWVFDPDAGGKKIPETVKRDIEKRIHAVANEQFKGRYKRLEIRFRGQFCCGDYPKVNHAEKGDAGRAGWPSRRA